MKQGISKTRRFIETFLLIGFFTLFISLAGGQTWNKVETAASIPPEIGKQVSSTKSISRYLQCNSITIYDETTLQNWVNNETQLPLNLLKTDPTTADSVMDVVIEMKYRNSNLYYLTLRFSDKGKIYMVSSSQENCGGSAYPPCCFYYQNLCNSMEWLFPWMEFYCSSTFWKCWYWNDCFKNHFYMHWLFVIICKFLWCC
jgi:hypothetical protein